MNSLVACHLSIRRRARSKRADCWREVHESISKGETFALESTLSGRTYVNVFREARRLGYSIELHYLWLASPAQAIARVRQRVRSGGHKVRVAVFDGDSTGV
jgi:predicted ABC-type ATPase